MELDLSRYSWYIPSHIAAWRESQGGGVCGATELIVMNHPEAVAEAESVDFSLLFDGVGGEDVEDAVESRSVMADVMAAISSSSGCDLSVGVGGESSDLIDRFLEIKDLRIVAEPQSEGAEAQQLWEEFSPSAADEFEDSALSEELAAIYLSQGMFAEAKEIYNRLFLLYSEKSVYFAGLIDKIDKKQLNS